MVISSLSVRYHFVISSLCYIYTPPRRACICNVARDDSNTLCERRKPRAQRMNAIFAGYPSVHALQKGVNSHYGLAGRLLLLWSCKEIAPIMVSQGDCSCYGLAGRLLFSPQLSGGRNVLQSFSCTLVRLPWSRVFVTTICLPILVLSSLTWEMIPTSRSPPSVRSCMEFMAWSRVS